MRVLSSLAMLVLLPSAAHAVTVSKVEIRQGDRLLQSSELSKWLNVARCECDVALELSAQITGQGEVAVVSGDRCITSERRIDSSCTVLFRGEPEAHLRVS